MHLQPDHLRTNETVIEAFGISRKYTVLLILIGVLFLTLAVVGVGQRGAVLALLAAFGVALASLLATVVPLVLGLLGLYLVLLGIYFQLAYHYYFTDQRVMQAIGLFSMSSVSSEYKMITDLTVRQDVINRLILNTGTLGVNTAGGPTEEIQLTNIDDPSARRAQLRQLASAAQNGYAIDDRYLAKLKVETGMARNEAEALATLHRSVGESPSEHQDHSSPPPESPVGPTSPRPAPPSPVVPVSTADEVEDLHGDGIDESDRIRAAQKKLKQQ
ncbi:PH domain-containing protein [Candidatus Berkelbacteria bacterium]|nr:PH domain-containing protein [Candidatus Berkelbacteria bacterium]